MALLHFLIMIKAVIIPVSNGMSSYVSFPSTFPFFSLFVFTSGAVLGFMLGVLQIPGQQCDDLYRKLGSDVFKQNMIVGTVKMGWSHAFYDSEAWENILKSVSPLLFMTGWSLC